MAFTRSNDDRWLGGVCGGLAEYLGWDSTLVRLIYALLTIFSAAFPGVIIYIVLWLLMPPGTGHHRFSNLELQ